MTSFIFQCHIVSTPLTLMLTFTFSSNTLHCLQKLTGLTGMAHRRTLLLNSKWSRSKRSQLTQQSHGEYNKFKFFLGFFDLP